MINEGETLAPDTHSDPWTLAQNLLKETMDDYSYKNWFAQTRYESFKDGELTVGVPSKFFADWLRDHYLDEINESLAMVLPEFRAVNFHPVVEESKKYESPDTVTRVPHISTRQRVRKPSHGLNPRYTFDRFVIGAGNRFASAAAKAVAESPGRGYNPLFLYGDTGLGKTHLMQAIGHHLLQSNPNTTCVFISSESFMNQLIQSIADKSTHRFREKYRKVDVLLIDDVHFITGKEATQEEFFHTFNALFDKHKQIVLSSDRSPKEIQGIEERLVSRFEWGLVTDIQPPDLETREAILRNKADEENLTVDKDIIHYIATHITSNIRELEGALITVLAYSRLTQQKISLTLVQEVLRDLIGSEKIKPVTVEQVQRAVAEHFDVRIADLRGTSRQRQVVMPRQIAMYLCKDLIPSLSLNDVGEVFGGKDHTTVLYSCDKVHKEIARNNIFRQTIEQITKIVRNS